MNSKILSTGALLLVLVVMTGMASASATIILSNTNTPQLAGIKVQATYDDTNGKISYQYISGSAPVANTPLGIDTVYYNLNDDVASVSESGWTTNFDGPTADGFGSFLSHKNENSAGKDGISSPLVFTLDNPYTLPITQNGNGATTAVHVRFSNGCSGWVSDGTTTASSSNTACSSTQIPEFPNVAMPVGAAIGLVLLFQYRKKKEEQ